MKISNRLFNDQQIMALQNLSKKIPKVVKFLVADKFDDKFINSTNNIWNFYVLLDLNTFYTDC